MKTLGGAFLLLLLLSIFSGRSFAIDEFDDFTLPADCKKCTKATAAQKEKVQQGIQLLPKFLDACVKYGVRDDLCQQLARPNPDSSPIFTYTYGNIPHYLVDPNPATWKYAFKAGLMVQQLLDQNIKVTTIYNWWRPQPYDRNVRGLGARHPYGTAVDIRMANHNETIKALNQLCKWRKSGLPRAVGTYPSGTAIHIGVGDSINNTWGPNQCPRNR